MSANGKGRAKDAAGDGVTPPVKKLRRRRRALATRKSSFLKKNAPKLSLAQRLQVCEWLGWGWPAPKIVAALVEAGGPRVTPVAIRSYQKTHAEEVDAAREEWERGVRAEPLAGSRSRVRELRYLFGQTLREALKEPCAGCLGKGAAVAAAGPLAGVEGRCPLCRGLRWVLPDGAEAALARLEGDVRLETLPPGLVGRLTDVQAARLQALAAQIREEVGDAWSPRERGQTAGGDGDGGRHLHLHGAEGVKLAARSLDALREALAASPEQIVAIYRARAGLPAAPDNGAGGSDAKEGGER